MKLSEIRPCDNCGGKIAPLFYVVRTSLAIFKPQATNQVLGLNQMFGGNGLGLAEAMAPESDVITVAGDEAPEMMMELLICQDCYGRGINLAALVEAQ